MWGFSSRTEGPSGTNPRQLLRATSGAGEAELAIGAGADGLARGLVGARGIREIHAARGLRGGKECVAHLGVAGEGDDLHAVADRGDRFGGGGAARAGE